MAKRIPVLAVVPPLVFAALAGLLMWGMGRDNPEDLPSTFVGRAAPSVSAPADRTGMLPGIPGFTDADLRTGQVTLVNFWATWCPPCRAEHPQLVKMRDEGLRIVGVNIRDDDAKAVAYLAEEGNPFQGVIADPTGRLSIDWGVTAPPETFIVGGDGTVLFKFIGPLVGSDYEQRFLPELQKALAQPGS